MGESLYDGLHEPKPSSGTACPNNGFRRISVSRCRSTYDNERGAFHYCNFALTVDEESSTNVIELLDHNDPVLGLQSLWLTTTAGDAARVGFGTHRHCAVN
jgi:hypothetical protein